MENNIDRKPENIFMAEILDMKRQLEELKNIQPPTINLSNVSQFDFTINAFSLYNITITLSNTQSKILLAIPEIAFYKNQVVSAANYYPSGGNWTVSEVANLQVEAYLDWSTTDNKNLTMTIALYNGNGSNIPIRLVSRWRYLTPSAS